LSSKGPNYQRRVLLISAGATEGHFEGKTPRLVHQGGLVLARQFPGSLGNCNPEQTGIASDAEVIAASETWLDGQLSEFYGVACKS